MLVLGQILKLGIAFLIAMTLVKRIVVVLFSSIFVDFIV